MEKKAGQALHEDEEPEGEEDYTYLTVDDQEAEDGEEVVYTLDDGEEEQGEELSENNDRSGNDLRVSEGDRPELKEHKQTVGQPVENQLKQSDNIVKEGNHTAAEGKNMIVVHKPIPGLKPQPAFKIIGIQQESTDKHRIANEENPAIANNREIHPKNAQEKKTSNEFSFPPAHTAVKDVSLKETTQITSPPGQLNLQREKNQDSFSLENHQKKEKSKPIVPVDPFPRSNTISELSDHSLHQKFYTPSIPISKSKAEKDKPNEDDDWNIDFNKHQQQPTTSIKQAQSITNKSSESLVDSKVVNTSKKVSPIEPLKEKYFKIKSSNESFRNLDVGKSSTLSEIDWFDNEDKILTNHQTPKNPQQIKKSLENQEFELFTKPKPSKVTIVNKEHLPSGLLAAGSKITYRADLKPKLFQSKGNGVLTSAELPKQITSKSKGLDSLKKSPSISNLGSRGSLNLKEMMNSKPNKYLLESLQGSSTNLLNYSKLSTPKDSKIPTESVPSRAFPLIRTNSKGSISKDNSPDTSRNLASKFPKHLNPINSPTFKQKKLFELNETSKKSYSRPSVLKDESSSSAFVKNSVKDDDFKAAHSIRDPSESQDNFFAKETTAKESLSALRRKGESNFSLRNFEDKHYFLAQSAVQSRRTSKPTALPVLGSHAINTKSPVMTTAKKNGPAFSSLNSSKVHPFRLSSEKSLVISPTINPEGKKDFGQSPSGKKNALSRPWLNKVMSFLKWTEDQNSSFNLETQERLNNIAGSLLAEAKEQYLMMKLKQSEDSKDTLDTTTQVNSYTKGTLSYLKLRYKKEEESNKVIIEALTDELERLVQIKDSMDDPG